MSPDTVENIIGLKVQLTDLILIPRNLPCKENLKTDEAKEKASNQATWTFLEVKRFNKEERN